MVLNDQGGAQMGISYDVTSTLRAEDHQHPPLVMHEPTYSLDEKMGQTYVWEEQANTLAQRDYKQPQAVFSAGFSFGQSAKARSLGYQEEISPTIRGGEGGNQKPCVVTAVPIENHPNDSRVKLCGDGVVQTLSGRMGTGGNNTPLVMETKPNAIAFTQNQREEVRDLEDVATAVQAESGTHQQTYVATCIGNGQGDIASHISEDVSQTLNCMHDPMAVYVPEVGHDLKAKSNCQFREDSETYVATAVDCRNATENPNVNGTLQAKEQGQNLNSNNVCRTNNVVRRLTPMECERLQNFPDLWTSIGDWVDSKGKLHKGDADSPRYKALGNSIALPFWDWLLGRISAQYDRPATLGSLFSGIGGFDLCWEKHNGKGTALWQSEIEEFPIAVCKKHFGDEDAGLEGDADEYL